MSNLFFVNQPITFPPTSHVKNSETRKNNNSLIFIDNYNNTKKAYFKNFNHWIQES